MDPFAFSARPEEGAGDAEESLLYAWEGIYERPWEAVREAADGSLVSADAARRGGGGKVLMQTGVKRGVLRSLFLVVDASKAANDPDHEMRPTRLAVMVEAASQFVGDFFEQNPISTLAVLVTRDGRAELLTEASCNPRQHQQALARVNAVGGAGGASLQNALELARESLHAAPSFTSREAVVLSASLSSCDPGDILATIGALRRAKLRVSIFSLVAEVFICKKIAADTGGEFAVANSPAHVRDLLQSLVPPRPTASAAAAAPSNSLIRVGFPRRADTTVGSASQQTLAFSPGGGPAPSVVVAGYRCPQCAAAHTELPTQCQVCGLKLMSSVELTKTYHHLFPVAAFTPATRPMASEAIANGGGGRGKGKGGKGGGSAAMEVEAAAELADEPPGGYCFGCAERLPAAASDGDGDGGGGAALRCSGFECPECRRLFCGACDELIHATLRTCPGCCMPKS